MKLNNYFLVFLLTFTGFSYVLTQPSLNVPAFGNGGLVIFALPKSRATHSHNFVWTAKENALSYIVRIFRRQDDVMVREVRDLLTTSANITGLQSGTRYKATVAAVYMNEGRQVETPQSPSFMFKTNSECTNGRVYTQCTAHCISTCENPNPVCSRICRSGCGCPSERPIWHGGKCVLRSDCPAALVSLSKPQNARVLTISNDAVEVVWDPVQDTKNYKIKVINSRTNEVVQTVTSFPPIASVSNLEAGTSYKLAISAVPNEPQFGGSVAAPRVSSVTSISENSFRVNWEPRDSALVYTFHLYAENRDLLMVVKNLQDVSIVVQHLNPGTTYYFALASGSPLRYGELTQLQRVTTSGEASNTEDAHAAVVTVSIPSAVETPRCRQLYESVSNFNTHFASGVTLDYPECDQDGNFVTTKCESNVCWCVDKITGTKITGSDYGTQASDFTLNCNKFGKLRIGSLQLRARNLSTTSLQLEWNSSESVRGYVLIISDKMRKPRIVSVNGASTNSHELQQLRSGRNYKIGIFAVDNNGVSSSVSYIETSTALLERPENVVVREQTPSSVSLTWRYSARAEGFDVKVISLGNNTIIRSLKTARSTITIENLEPSRYIIEIREIICNIGCERPGAETVRAGNPAAVEVNLQCALPVMDILFAFDTSANSNLAGQKQLAKAIIAGVPPLNRQTGTRIGAVKYDQQPRLLFSYNRYQEDRSSEMLQTIEQLQAIRNYDTPRTGLMLNYVNSRFFNPGRSDAYKTRTNARSVFIVLSGGNTSDGFGFQRVSRELKTKSTVMAVKMNSSSNNNNVFETMVNASDLFFDATGRSDYRNVANAITESFCRMNRSP